MQWNRVVGWIGTGVMLGGAALGSPLKAGQEGSLRVAVLGDSITVGTHADAGDDLAASLFSLAYPAVLGRLLGDGFEVQPFAQGGRSLRPDRASPFVTTQAFRDAIAYAPDIAILMLGTNDTNSASGYDNWPAEPDGADWSGWADAIVEPLKHANPAVRVLLTSPPAIFPNAAGLDDARRANLLERQPRIDQITGYLQVYAGATPGVEFVDVREVLRPRDVTDGVHPNPFGAERLAYRLVGDVLRTAGAEGVDQRPTTTPMPSGEYRGKSAGWGGGTWRSAYASLIELATKTAGEEPVEVLFLGDSITQGLTGHPSRFTAEGGTRAIDEFYGDRRAVSVGLSGDRTEHLLYRIASGSLDGFRPRVIVLQIGINNINAAGHSGADTFAGVTAVVDSLLERFQRGQILVCGPFPGGVRADSRVRRSVEEVHARLAAHGFQDRVRYVDLSHLFVDEAGTPRTTLGRDGIHVTEAGKAAWMAGIQPHIEELLGQGQSTRFPAVELNRPEAGRIHLASDVTVDFDPENYGVAALTVGGTRVSPQPDAGGEWKHGGADAELEFRSWFPSDGEAVLQLAFRPQPQSVTESGESPQASPRRHPRETVQLATLGAARGYERTLTVRSRPSEDPGAVPATIERTLPSLRDAEATPIFADEYGRSTVSTPGTTYDLYRFDLEGGRRAWLFRSYIHVLNQSLNPGVQPRLREVLLMEPADRNELGTADILGAYVLDPADKEALVSKWR